MSAVDEGAKRGFAYARGHPIARMTFEEYCQVGKGESEHRYIIEKARFAFLYGWRQAGELNRTIFKLEDSDLHGGERRIQAAKSIIEKATERLEEVLYWREEDSEMHGYLMHAYDLLGVAARDLERARRKL